MAKTYNDKIAAAKKEIAQKEAHIKQLLKLQKAQERKERTKRLCSRHGLFEKLLPDSINLSDEQFEKFLNRTVANDFGRGKLTEMIKAVETVTTPASAETTAATDSKATSTTAEPPPVRNTGGNTAKSTVA